MATAEASTGLLAIFWDIENCGVPRGKSAVAVAQCIRNAFLTPNIKEAEFMCVCDVTREPSLLIYSLNEAHVTVVHVSNEHKNAADDKLKTCMRKFSDSHKAPVTLVLISADVDFAADLSHMRNYHKYHIILVHNNNSVKEALSITANEVYSFDEIVRNAPEKEQQVVTGEEEVHLVQLKGLPVHVELAKVRTRLATIVNNTKGQVIHCTKKNAIIKYKNSTHAARAAKRMNQQDFFGTKISCIYVTNATSADGFGGVNSYLETGEETRHSPYNHVPWYTTTTSYTPQQILDTSCDLTSEHNSTSNSSSAMPPAALSNCTHLQSPNNLSANKPVFTSTPVHISQCHFQSSQRPIVKRPNENEPVVRQLFTPTKGRITLYVTNLRLKHRHLIGSCCQALAGLFQRYGEVLGSEPRSTTADADLFMVLVHVAADYDTDKAIKDVHGRKFGDDYILVSRVLESPAQFRVNVIRMFDDVPEKRMPLFALMEKFEKNFHQPICTYQLHLLRDVVKVEETANGVRIVHLIRLPHPISVSQQLTHPNSTNWQSTQSTITNKLPAHAVSANQLPTPAVSANQLSAHAVSANQLLTPAVSANQLSAHAVSANQLSAHAVSANPLTAHPALNSQLLKQPVMANQLSAHPFSASELAAHPASTNHQLKHPISTNQMPAYQPPVTQQSAQPGFSNQLTTVNQHFTQPVSTNQLPRQPASANQPLAQPTPTYKPLTPHSSPQHAAERPYCNTHCCRSQFTLVEERGMLPYVKIQLDVFTQQVHSLLEKHLGELHLMSFTFCYEAIYSKMVETSDGGVPLEHLISCVTGVYIRVDSWGVKKIYSNIDSGPNSPTMSGGDTESARRSPTSPDVDMTKFSHEVINLLKQMPGCQMSYSKFIPSYRHYYGLNSTISDFERVNISDLFKSLSQVIQVLGTGNQKVLFLTHEVQRKRFSKDLIKVLNAQPRKQCQVNSFPQCFSEVLGTELNMASYGVCYISDMLADIPTSDVTVQGTGGTAVIAIPRKEQTSQQEEKTIEFSYEAVKILKNCPSFILLFNGFIPAYHQLYGKQCRLADYGFSKLKELFEVISDVVTMKSYGEILHISLTLPELYNAFSERLLTILNSCSRNCLDIKHLGSAYQRSYGYRLQLETFGATSVKDLIRKIPNIAHLETRAGADVIVLNDKSNVKLLASRCMELFMVKSNGCMKRSVFVENYRDAYGDIVDMGEVVGYLSPALQIRDGEGDNISLHPVLAVARRIVIMLNRRNGKIPVDGMEEAFRRCFGTSFDSQRCGYPKRVLFQILEGMLTVSRQDTKETLVLKSAYIARLSQQIAYRVGVYPELIKYNISRQHSLSTGSSLCHGPSSAQEPTGTTSNGRVGTSAPQVFDANKAGQELKNLLLM